MAKRTGFAIMSKERHLEIAAMGGRSVPREKRSFFTNRTLATDAGRKGGMSVPAGKRIFSHDRDLAKEASKLGVLARTK